MKQPHQHVLVVAGDEQFAIDTVRAVRALGLSASSAGSLKEAVALADRDRPALLIADVDIGGELAGAHLADTIRRRWGSAIILMSTRTDPETVSAMATAGSSGVLCKPFHCRQLEVTLRLALERRATAQHPVSTLAPDPADGSTPSRTDLHAALLRIAAELSRVGLSTLGPGHAPHHEWLTSMRPREQEVVTLLLQHQRVPAIARTLSISQETVRNHLKRVFSQMGVHSQQELLLLLQRTPNRPSGVPDRPSTSAAQGR